MKKSKDNKRFQKFILDFSDFLSKHWIFSLVFIRGSTLWIPLLYTYGGIQLKLVQSAEESYKLSCLGLFVLAFLLIVLFAGEAVQFYTSRFDRATIRLKEKLVEHQENAAVLSDLARSSNALSDSRLSTLIDKVDEYAFDRSRLPPEIISDPKRQLNKLASELSHCIAYLLKFPDNGPNTDIFSSIIYRFPKESNEWGWATREQGLSIDELTDTSRNETSTFQALLTSKGHYIFRNSKQDALESGQYFPDNEDEYDENNKLKGSIACFQYTVKKNNKTLIEFVITITSYSRRFIEGELDKKTETHFRENIDKVILPGFVIQAKAELCLLYLLRLNDKKTIDTTKERIKVRF